LLTLIKKIMILENISITLTLSYLVLEIKLKPYPYHSGIIKLVILKTNLSSDITVPQNINYYSLQYCNYYIAL